MMMRNTLISLRMDKVWCSVDQYLHRYVGTLVFITIIQHFRFGVRSRNARVCSTVDDEPVVSFDGTLGWSVPHGNVFAFY